MEDVCGDAVVGGRGTFLGGRRQDAAGVWHHWPYAAGWRLQERSERGRGTET